MVNLSEDEVKILLNILNQLNFKLPDAKIVQPIVDKLKKVVKEPVIEDPGSYDPSNPDKGKPKNSDVIEAEIITPEVIP